nr:HTH domain-containing protein [Ornithinimicrobium sp. HY1745]
MRRVERQQHLIELLAGAERRTVSELAEHLGVSTRTVERDVERLRDAGVPFETSVGRAGGISLPVTTTRTQVELDVAEIAALLSSLATVGPNSSPSANSATAKLAAALLTDVPRVDVGHRR